MSSVGHHSIFLSVQCSAGLRRTWGCLLQNVPVTPQPCNENIDFLGEALQRSSCSYEGCGRFFTWQAKELSCKSSKTQPKIRVKKHPIMHQQVTHMTWKGQLGVWRNLSSLMLLWGTVFRVERHQHLSTRLMGLAENNNHKHSKILYQVPGTRYQTLRERELRPFLCLKTKTTKSQLTTHDDS